MFTRFLSLISILTALLLTVNHAQATVLDQEFVPEITGGINIGGIYTAQTLTAGVTGTLDSVSVHISNFGGSGEDVTLSVYSTLLGEPSSSLGGVTLDYTAFPTSAFVTGADNFTTFDFLSFGIEILANIKYALVITTSETNNKYSWRSSAEGPTQYDGGQRYTSTDGVNWTGNADWDFAFQTFVNTDTLDEEPSSIPEPAPIALLALGLVGIRYTRNKSRGQ